VRDKCPLLLFIALMVFLIGLGRRDIVISHEARVAQTARQMAASGAPWNARRLIVPVVAMKDIGSGVMRLAPAGGAAGEGSFSINPWLVPVLNTQIRLQKPPLPYWCDAVCFEVFGVNEFAARLVPALLGALGTLLVYDLARHLATRRVALLSALAWISTHFVVEEFRKSMADPYLAFATLLATAAWIRASGSRTRWGMVRERELSNIKSPSTADAPSPLPSPGGGGSALIVFYVSTAIGMLAKGPVIFLWLAITLVSFHLSTRRPFPRNIGAHILGLLLFLLLGCSWYVAMYLTVPHAINLWKYESVGELTSNTENVREWWFYFLNGPLILLPWLAMIVIGAAREISRRRFFLILWPAVALLLFSLVNQKKNAYLLPATPPLAILAGQGLATLVAIDRARRGIKWPGILAGIQSAVGIGFSIVTLILLLKFTHTIIALVIATGAVGVAVYPLVKLLGGDLRGWPVSQSIAYAILLMVFISFYESEKENTRSARAFAHSAQSIIDSAGGRIIPAAIPEEASFYLPLNYTGPRTTRQLFSIVDDPRNTITADDPRLIYASKSGRWKLLKQQTR
jgi:4-amino-4-deoxy-L-arabinose transferase-like glycosyltransferase